MLDNIHELLAAYLREASILAYFAAYLGGLLMSFTPCIYPVIPLTVGIVATRGKGIRGGGFWHALVYVTGISLTYSLLGVAAASTGALFGQWQTNPWIYLFLGNLCLIMGLAKLGLFHFSLTSSFESKFRHLEGFFGTLILGMASGLVVGPCTAPVLAVLLGYVAVSQQIFYGATLLFVFAFGMGTLLILLGTGANLMARLPKSGNWLLTADRIIAFLLLAVGEYFLVTAGTMFI